MPTATEPAEPTAALVLPRLVLPMGMRMAGAVAVPRVRLLGVTVMAMVVAVLLAAEVPLALAWPGRQVWPWPVQAVRLRAVPAVVPALPVRSDQSPARLSCRPTR